MPILTMPAAPKVRRLQFGLRANTQAFSAMTKALPGERWAGTFELPPMKRPQAAAWCAFLTRCNGRAGRFYAGDPASATPRGTITGTPLVFGAGQTGTLLNTYGWGGAAGTYLCAGDYVAWDTPSGWREMHLVTADVVIAAAGATYGTGQYGAGGYGHQGAQIPIAPAIRESPAADEPLIFTSPTCVMRLIDDEQAAWDIETALIYRLRFAAEEVWP